LKVEKAVHYGPDPRHRLDVSTPSGTCPRHLTESDILGVPSECLTQETGGRLLPRRGISRRRQ
jgi:hypothetical protein